MRHLLIPSVISLGTLLSACNMEVSTPEGDFNVDITDTTPPVIHITSPDTSGVYKTANGDLVVSGTASDNVSLSEVTWTLGSGESGVAQGTGSWSISALPLHAGDNVLTVTAHDSSDNTADESITIQFEQDSGDDGDDNTGTDPGDGTTDPGDGTTDPGDGSDPDPVDTTAPQLVETIPAEQKSVSTTSPTIIVTFDEAIDAASVTGGAVSLLGPSGDVALDISVEDASINMKPTSSLARGSSYTATVSASVTDLAGNALGEDYSWHFSVSDDSCASGYSDGFTLVEGKDPTPPDADLARPAKGESYTDPAYGTCVVRATDHEAEGIPGFSRNDYSRRQAFSADDSHFLTLAQNGYFHLYRTSDLSHLGQIIAGGSTEPQWHPTNPDLIYLFGQHGVGMKLYELNIKTRERRTIADFDNVTSIAGHPGKTGLTDIWPNAYRAWTKSEGSPSADARYWALQVETKDFQRLGMVTYDLETDTILGVFDFASHGVGRPDHISMSPSGEFVVPSWNNSSDNCSGSMGTRDNPCGLMSYTRDFSQAVGLAQRGPHSDIGIDANGRDVIIASDYNEGWVQMWDLETGEKTRLFEMYNGGAETAMHFSTKNFNKPGWALISTYAEKRDGWFARKLFAIELKANPRILNIAHSYNRVETYFSETHASVNRDFTRILFNSNWNTTVDNIDAYMITLPEDAVPDVN